MPKSFYTGPEFFLIFLNFNRVLARILLIKFVHALYILYTKLLGIAHISNYLFLLWLFKVNS